MADHFERYEKGGEGLRQPGGENGVGTRHPQWIIFPPIPLRCVGTVQNSGLSGCLIGYMGWLSPVTTLKIEFMNGGD